ncbi:Dynein light chain [Meloidogyne graminicola]|uniref:Dynein light chain n=1 Tax=Meloidogyne graminicola TaxID=189291 RepID=A0A8S9ZTW6_9BILA|nr:Dynein light chain [Meloidogyne graminicola]
MIIKMIGNKKIIIITSKMSKEMETQAIYFSIRAIMKHKETMEIAKCIEKKLNKKYGKDWCCNIGGNFGAFTNFFRGKYGKE